MTPSWKRIPRAVAATVALDTAPFGVLWVDEEGFISYVNKHLEVHLGLSSQEALGQPISFITHFWGNGNWKDTVWPKTANGIIHEQVSEWQARTGPSISFNTTIHRIQVAGQEVAVHYLTHPVTRNHQSLALGLLPEFTESWKNGLAVVTDLLEVEQTNSAFIRLLGIDSDAAIGRNIAEIILQNEGCESPWIRLKNQGLDDFLVTYLSPAGQTLNLALSSRNDRNSETTRYFIFVEDRSEQAQLKQMLAQQKHSLEAMSAHTPGMIYKFTLSPEGKASFPYASPGVRDIWEVDPSEIVNDATPILRLIHADDIGPFQQSVMESATTLSAWEFEGRIITQSGKQKWFHAASRPELDGDGNIVWQGLLMDITHQKSLEQELKVAMVKAESATRAKADFLANMSHEIRTPMNGIIGMAELLINTEMAPRQRHYVETIRSSAEVLLAILNDILDLSKMEAGKLCIHPVSFDLKRTLDDVAMLLAPSAFGKGLDFVVRYDLQAPIMVVGDAVRIRQILTNLIGNAIKFTSEGHVLVFVEQISRQEDKSFLRFQIKDTGIGISQEAMKYLFKKFEQAESSISRRFGGTGLGLAISKQLVEIMGGRMEVESTLSVGSTFSFQLSLPIGPNTDPTAAAADFSSLRILGVDDHPVNREILTEFFEIWKVREHKVCSEGEVALQFLREATRSGNPFQVAVLDFQMPVMDGVTLANAIRAEPEIADISIIMLSSSTFSNEQLRILSDAGMVAHLLKPLRPFELQQAISAALALPIPVNLTSNEDESPQSSLGLNGAKEVLNSDVLRSGASKIELRVLLVEDNEVNAEIASSMLGSLGCNVEFAGNGIEAVEKASAHIYDLIFMDCQMPEMDGFEATRKIRTLPITPKSIIIAMTAFAMEGDREKCLAAGMDDYLSKPVTFALLTKMVRKYADRIKERRVEDAAQKKDVPTPIRQAVIITGLVFDLNAGLAQTGGKRSILKKAIEIWWRKLPVWVGDLKVAIQTNNVSQASRVAHSIRGAAGSIGATSVSSIATRIELQCENIEDVASLYDVLIMEVDRLQRALSAVVLDD